MALRFGASNNTRVKDSDAENYLNGLDEVAFCMWINNTASIGNNNGIFTTKDPPDGSDTQIGIRYDDAGWGGGGDNVIKMSLTCTGGEISYESSSYVQIKGWQHLCVNWKSGEDIEMFIDGVEDTPTYLSGGSTTGTVSGVALLQLGVGSKGSNTSVGWVGDIEDFRVYNRKLTANEILTIYSLSGRDGMYDGLLTRYVFNEKSPGGIAVANEMIDISGNGHDLDVVVGTAYITYTSSPVTSPRRSMVKSL